MARGPLSNAFPRRFLGCYQCSRRRISCDRTEPQCLKCTRTDLECSGLGTRYRWAKPVKLNTLKGATCRPTKRSAKGILRKQEHGQEKTSAPIKDLLLDFDSTSPSTNLCETTISDQCLPPTNIIVTNFESRVPFTVLPSCREDQWAIHFCQGNIPG